MKNILHAFEKTGISPFDATKTLSIIEKRRILELAPIQITTPIACRDVRLVEKDFHYGSPSKSRIDWPRSGPVRTVAFFGDRLKRLDRTVQHLRTTVRSQKY